MYNTCINSVNISCFLSEGITVSSTFLQLSLGASLGFTILSAVFIPIHSPVASAVLWTYFLEAVFRTSSLVLVAAFNIFSPYLSNRFLTNNKNLHPLMYFLVLGSIELRVISIY